MIKDLKKASSHTLLRAELAAYFAIMRHLEHLRNIEFTWDLLHDPTYLDLFNTWSRLSTECNRRNLEVLKGYEL